MVNNPARNCATCQGIQFAFPQITTIEAEFFFVRICVICAICGQIRLGGWKFEIRNLGPSEWLALYPAS